MNKYNTFDNTFELLKMAHANLSIEPETVDDLLLLISEQLEKSNAKIIIPREKQYKENIGGCCTVDISESIVDVYGSTTHKRIASRSESDIRVKNTDLMTERRQRGVLSELRGILFKGID